MDPPDPFTTSGNHPSPIRRSAELQGPRPTPLKVNKDSHKIKKPPIPPHPHHHHHLLLHQPPLPPPHPAATTTKSNNPQPVIIYSVSPKVIHTTVSDFMNLVQSLTGPSTTTAATSTSGDISPAARIASIENTSPSERERERLSSSSTYPTIYGENDYDEISRILDQTNYFPTGSLQNNTPSILSPAPAMLPPASPPGLFSPAVADPFIQAASNMFIPSPSTLFSAPMVSPSPSSSYHFYNSIFDF